MLYNITTFLDDEEIETGLSLKPELESAIKASRASIIVLSQNYASSTWCLNELALILEQCKNSDHIVIPIFYHVEPTDIRKQQSSFGEAMAKHKQRMETEANAEKRSQWAQKMDIWNKALTEVADLKGEIAKGRKETELINEIVTEIHHKLGVSLSNTPPPLIGMYRDIRFITSWLTDGSSHTADILTIWGMGGTGKTSLAEHLFRLHSHEFQRSSFIADISRKCAEKSGGLLDLQNQICHDISKTSSIQVHNVSAYTSQIENAIARRKVFLVLDDVDSLDHLDALLGKKGFHPGSKIIITTKDASLTEKCELFNQIVQPKHAKHLLQGLDDYNSLQLLSLWAFKRNSPKEGYEEVSDTLVKYCGGHPLALKVLGRSLCNRDVARWNDCIKRLKQEPDSCIKNVLQMSFDSLSSTRDKELFKHIACFFVGENRESTETILKACGIHTVLGIENLIDRCLLWISQDNKLMMHQLLQEMGRDIVRQESPNRPEERSRLWRHQESFKVLKQKKGKGNLQGLALDMRMLEKDKLHELETDALSNMDNLMLLQLNYVHQIKGSYKNFPQDLRWLCMHGFPLEYIPPDLQVENLVVLDMSYSRLVSFDMSYNDPQQLENRQKLTGLGSIYEQFRSLCGLLELPILENRQKMLYGFGIFSTFYVGKEIPNWISERSKGPSISFTIPSSPNNLRGLNICFMLMVPNKNSIYSFVDMKISNITKNSTWIYTCPVFFKETREGITYLSHWMFGKNEMEDGDQITISILKEYDDDDDFSIRECGVSSVYDGKNKMEEEDDALGYYKSWNHIIGGDLSPFQTTTPGEYHLYIGHFLGSNSITSYVDKRPLFRAFP